MTKRLFAALGIAAMAVSAPASAVKLGIGAALTTGDSEFDFDGGFSDDADSDGFEFGFALDTGSVERTFNYRLHADIVLATEEFGGGFEVDRAGISVTNTFGFALNQPAKTGVKVWLGPSISVLAGGFDDTDGDEGTYAGIGIGPTLGLDFLSQSAAQFSLELAYRLQYFDAEYDNSNFSEFDADVESDEIILRGSVLWGR